MTLFRNITLKRGLWATGIFVGCLVLANFRALYNLAHGGARPFCHNGMIGSIDQWLIEQDNKGDHTGNYPDVMGDSRKSMDLFSPWMAPEDVSRMHRDYAYVPGLRVSDPKDLIFMHMTVPTRFTWHGDNPSVNRKPEWLIFAPYWANEPDSPSWCPEGA